MRTNSRLSTVAVVLLASAALAAPAVAQQDLRSPDTRDAAASSPSSAPAQDLRSPDARDLAAGRSTTSAVVPATPEPATAVVVKASSGFDWGSAAIGGAAILGLLAIAAGGLLFMRHHHDTTPPAGIIGV